MKIKNILCKLREFIPGFIFNLCIGLVGVVAIYGAQQLFVKYFPSLFPITSGSHVVFDQRCFKASVDKKGKKTCLKKGPLVIYTVRHAESL